MKKFIGLTVLYLPNQYSGKMPFIMSLSHPFEYIH